MSKYCGWENNSRIIMYVTYAFQYLSAFKTYLYLCGTDVEQ
jgi:hypothetical protein